ncbi:MAG: hypothetical protein WCO04_13710 [Pseudomonadota bacterium]
MKPSVIIHIGFPKTATTTLQTHVFPRLPSLHYLGKFEGNPPEDPRLLYFDIHVAKVAGIKRPTMQFSQETALALLREGREQGKTTMISLEEIAGACLAPTIEWSNRGKLRASFGLRDVLPPLIGFCETAGLGRPRFVVTLREQGDLLTSYYAQTAMTLYRGVPEAKSFAAFVDCILNRPDLSDTAFLDYPAFEDELAAIAGPDAYRLIAHEWLRTDPARYAAAWAEALSVPVAEFEAALQAAPAENVRRRIGPDGTPQLAMKVPSFWSLLSRVRLRLMPNRSLGIAQRLQRIVGHYRMPARSFSPDAAVVETIRERYRASNAEFLHRRPEFAALVERAGRGMA